MQHQIPNIYMKYHVYTINIELAHLSQGYKMQYQIPNIHMKYHIHIVINQYGVGIFITRTQRKIPNAQYIYIYIYAYEITHGYNQYRAGKFMTRNKMQNQIPNIHMKYPLYIVIGATYL